MRPTTVVLFYWWRLRTQPLQELLAAAGIAAGVALLFAVQVANSSITGSVEQLVHGITGQFSLQIAARDARGFDQALADRVSAADGVRVAAPVLEQRVGIAGPRGRANVDLVGVTGAISDVGGPLVSGFGGRFGPRLAPALLLPKPLADRLGTSRGRFVTLATRQPVALRVPVSATLDRSQIGTAIDSPLAVAPLSYVQTLTGLPRRVTRILVAVEPGQEAKVRAELTTLAGGRLSVERSDVEIKYVDQAATPNNQSTGLFAGICAIVGILLAFTAMLLTLPDRRRFADLRIQGYKRHQILTSIVFEASVLGIVASLFGLGLGDALLRYGFHSTPGYLEFAFPIGNQRVVPPRAVALSLAAGLLTAYLATVPLLRELFSRRLADTSFSHGEPVSESLGPRGRLASAGSGAALLVSAAALAALVPRATIVCVLLLAIGMLALLPVLLAGVLWLIDIVIDRVRGSALPVALMELRESLLRATALAATGALAVFGIVAIQGAHRDLLHGLDVTAASMLGTTDVWVTAPGDANILMTTPFTQPDHQALRQTGDVAAVRAYRGEFLDMAGRRVWIMARPPNDRTLIPPTQIKKGNIDTATRRIRSDGWAALSASIADGLHVGVGDAFTLPTPIGPRRLRVAAVVSNLGWAPGSLVLNGHDYRRWWPGSDVTALEVDLRPGVAPAAGKAAIQHALPAGTPLLVETQTERKQRFGRLERQGLNRLTQISTLLLIASILAVAAAMVGTVWQQRPRLAALRMHGYSVGRVLRVLITQATLVLAPGALIGALFGLYGQVLGTRWLTTATGFPTNVSVSFTLAILTVTGVAVLATIVISIPGYVAARTEPSVACKVE